MPPQVWQLSNRFREVTPMSPDETHIYKELDDEQDD